MTPPKFIFLRLVPMVMSNSVFEDTLLNRHAWGLVILVAMLAVGQIIGDILSSMGVPSGRWLGLGIGVVTVFAVVALVYYRYSED